jgi:hypothetical protein
MAQPIDRTSFIQYCLNQLGAPVIRIELDPIQTDQAVDDALTMFRENHYNGSQRTYLKHTVTSTDITNRWFPVDDSILNVISLCMANEANLNIFDIRYQLRLQDFYNFSNVSMQHYVITMEKLSLLDWLLNPQPKIEFNRLNNRLYANVDWSSRVNLGDILVFECYQSISESSGTPWDITVTYNLNDVVSYGGTSYISLAGSNTGNTPSTAPVSSFWAPTVLETQVRLWQDRWLKKYATALMRKQWGANLKKFKNVATLGGVTLDGKEVYEEGKSEVKELEEELFRDYQAPTRIFIG